MRAPIILGLAALLAAGLAHAEQTAPLDRASVLRLARERSPQVLAARARLDEAAGALSGARAWAHNPELELEFTKRETADGRYRDRGWRVDQRLDLLGRGARIGAARAGLAAADGQRLDAHAAAAAEAARAWLLALHAGAQRTLADEGAAVQERLRAVAAARYAAGETGALDDAVATVALARARAAQASSRSAEWDARADLAALLLWDSARNCRRSPANWRGRRRRRSPMCARLRWRTRRWPPWRRRTRVPKHDGGRPERWPGRKRACSPAPGAKRRPT